MVSSSCPRVESEAVHCWAPRTPHSRKPDLDCSPPPSRQAGMQTLQEEVSLASRNGCWQLQLGLHPHQVGVMSVGPVQKLDPSGALLLEVVPHNTPRFHLQLTANHDGARVSVQDLCVVGIDDMRQAHPALQIAAQATTSVKVVGSIDKVAHGVQDIHTEVVIPPVPEAPYAIADLFQLGNSVRVGDNWREAAREPARDVHHATVNREPDRLPGMAPDLCIKAKETLVDDDVLGRWLPCAQGELRDSGRHVRPHAIRPQLALDVLADIVGHVQLLSTAPLENVGHREDWVALPAADRPVRPELVRGLGPPHLRAEGLVQRVPPRGGEDRSGGWPCGADPREQGDTSWNRSGRWRRREPGLAGPARRPVEGEGPRKPVVHAALRDGPEQRRGAVGVDHGKAPGENDGGPVLPHPRYVQPVEDVVPLAPAELLRAGELQRRGERNHLDAVDILGRSTEPRRVVDLSLREHPSHPIAHEVLRVVGVAVQHEEVLPDAVGSQ
mmetsp:Transcript_69274/g.206263  ORF Transcript_69274/g.206263 Transcript_69274/m.206263 type:complete len:498 (-) Transcript_69274:977-2470(-)